MHARFESMAMAFKVSFSTLNSGNAKYRISSTSLTDCRKKYPSVLKSHTSKAEIFRSMEKWAEQNILTYLKPVEKSWQSQDFLPNPASDGFIEEVRELRKRAKEITDDYYVCLVGDMITEEALPTYMTVLNTNDGIRDETGSSPNPWAVWTRGWTAEENRHGDLLNKYLYLSGRVDMHQIEKTIQYLLCSGMTVGGGRGGENGTGNDPYTTFVYTSFQERATSVSHGNTARFALNQGDVNLARLCGAIASDEKRHEAAYQKIVEKLFEVDTNETMLAFAEMMKRKVVMPAQLMYDGRDEHLFRNFSRVTQRLGVYTSMDYADILQFLVERWNVEKITADLDGNGREAQDYVCKLAPRIRALAERSQNMKNRGEPNLVPFSWIRDRKLPI